MPRRWASRRCAYPRASIFRRTSRGGRRLARASAGWRRAYTPPGHDVSQQLPRVMRLRDVVLFNISAIVGLRWLTTAASQFGLASLLLWLLGYGVFLLPSAVAVRELADIDPGAGGIYRWVRRAFGPLHGFVAGWGYWVNNLFYFPSLLVATAAIAAYAGGPRFVRLGDDNVFIGALSLAGVLVPGGVDRGGLPGGERVPKPGGDGASVAGPPSLC